MSKEKKVTVVAAFCDKDFLLVPFFLKNVEERLKIPHDVVLVDNREKNRDVLVIEGARVYSEDRNLMTFEARRKAVLNMVKTPYTWLCDIDDELNVVTDFDYTEDMVVFNYMYSDGKGKYYSQKNPLQMSYTVSDTSFLHNMWKERNGNMVWNKFIKTEILKKIYEGLPDGLEICFTEDTVLNILLMPAISTIRYDNHFYYVYMLNSGDTTKTEYTDIEPLRRQIKGMCTGFGILNAYLPERIQKLSQIDVMSLYRGGCRFYVEKYPNVKNREEYIDFLTEYFSPELIIKLLPMCKMSNKCKKALERKLKSDYTKQEEKQNASK